jgi:hypothetical protein
MTNDLENYRFARIEGYNLTKARLTRHFQGGITDLEAFEATIARELATQPADCAPWRTSEIEKTGCLDGIRLAALEFYWSKRTARSMVRSYSA